MPHSDMLQGKNKSTSLVFIFLPAPTGQQPKLFEHASKENMRSNKSVSGINPDECAGSCDGKQDTQEVAC